MPISFETYILFYNKDLVSTPPATYADLIAQAKQITTDKGSQGISGAVMRGIRSDTIMDTLSGVVWNAWGAADAPTPYGMWFDGAWDKPRLTNEGVCQGLANYGNLLATGPSNKFALDWSDANAIFQQGKAAFFIDASLFAPDLRGRQRLAGVGQGRLLGHPTDSRRRRLLDRPLAVGPRHPEELHGEGRRLVLRPVDDEQGEHRPRSARARAARHASRRTPIRSTPTASTPTTSPR